MNAGPVHERLNRARAASGEELGALAARIGVRVHHLRAIEDGRFGDLPSGIYGRSAIRAFAAAYGLDPAEAVAECEARLPSLDDPIDAMARAHGVRRVTPAADAGREAPEHRPEPRARRLMTAALDAAIVGALEAEVCAGAAFVAGVPITALHASVVWLAVAGLAFGAACFLSCLTLRVFTVRSVRPRAPSPSRLRLPDLWPGRWSPASRPGVARRAPLPRPPG